MSRAEEEIEKGRNEYQILARGAHEKVFKKQKARFDKAIWQVWHAFEILDITEFDILKDVHEGVLMSIKDIPKKTLCASLTPTPLTNTLLTNFDLGEEEERQIDEVEFNN